MFGYKRAAATILALDLPLTDLVGSDGPYRDRCLGPPPHESSQILHTGESPTVEIRDRPAERRQVSVNASFGDISSAAPRFGVLTDPAFPGPTLQ
jgi:hypothetical protein